MLGSVAAPPQHSRGSRNRPHVQPPKHLVHGLADHTCEGLLHNSQVVASTSVLIPSHFNQIPDQAVLRSQNMLVRKSLFKVVEPSTLAQTIEAESTSSDRSAHQSSMHHLSWSIQKAPPSKVNRQVSISESKQ